MVERPKPVTLLKCSKAVLGSPVLLVQNIEGRCGFQVLDPTVAWILSRVGPTIRRGRGYPYLVVRLWSPMFLDYLLSSVVTLSRDKKSLPKGMRGSCRAHTLLSIILDGRSRGIVRTDPVLKPGVSSTLPSKKREML